MNGQELRAYLDESQSNQQRDPNTYLLAATLCPEDVLEVARDQMAALLQRGQHKVHWRDSSAPWRLKIAEAIAELPLDHVVVIREGSLGERIERRRRLCLKPMLMTLDDLAVATATFESRGPADDKRDRKLLDGMRASHHVSVDLRIEHQKGPLEPLLWLPDAICGAVTAQRTGDTQYLRTIEAAIQVNMVTLDS